MVLDSPLPTPNYRTNVFNDSSQKLSGALAVSNAMHYPTPKVRGDDNPRPLTFFQSIRQILRTSLRSHLIWQEVIHVIHLCECGNGQQNYSLCI